MTDLESEIKHMIVDVLNLEGVRPEEIDSNEDLFGGKGLALDSIDALELGVSIQKKFGVKIDPEADDVTALFKTVSSLAGFISRQVGEVRA